MKRLLLLAFIPTITFSIQITDESFTTEGKDYAKQVLENRPEFSHWGAEEYFGCLKNKGVTKSLANKRARITAGNLYAKLSTDNELKELYDTIMNSAKATSTDKERSNLVTCVIKKYFKEEDNARGDYYKYDEGRLWTKKTFRSQRVALILDTLLWQEQQKKVVANNKKDSKASLVVFPREPKTCAS